MKFTDEHGDPAIVKIVGTAIAALIVIIVLFSSFVQIGTGQRGVLTRFGNMVGQLKPGLHLKVPFIDKVALFDIQTQKEETNASAASSDLQTVSTKVAVNYNVDPNKVTTLFQTVGKDYSSRIIDPTIQETVKAVTANYTAEQLITKRAEVTSTIQTNLTEKLAANEIMVTGVSITNFDFSGQFNDAIEAKVTAEQNALGAKNLLDQKKYEAEQTIVTAEAQAKTIQIQTQAINSQGGAGYVALQNVKVQQAAVEKWDGKGCTTNCWSATPNMPVPFLNIK